MVLSGSGIATTLICGVSDGVFPLENCDKLKSYLQIPEDCYHIVKDAGHLSMMVEKPVEVNKIVWKFLTGLSCFTTGNCIMTSDINACMCDLAAVRQRQLRSRTLIRSAFANVRSAFANVLGTQRSRTSCERSVPERSACAVCIRCFRERPANANVLRSRSAFANVLVCVRERSANANVRSAFANVLRTFGLRSRTSYECSVRERPANAAFANVLRTQRSRTSCERSVRERPANAAFAERPANAAFAERSPNAAFAE